jgi:hypothetical protein
MLACTYIKIQIICTQISERPCQTLDSIRVESVPQLGSDEDLLARNPGLPDAFTYFGFILVDQGTIEVPVTLLQCGRHSTLNLAGRSLPSAYTRISINVYDSCKRDY